MVVYMRSIRKTWNIRHEFVPPHESLGVTYTGSDFRLILAPAIDEPDLERVG
jgi:hypothetical protein